MISDEREATSTFNCYYGGRFESFSGEIAYVGGSHRMIETMPSSLFSALMNQMPVSLYGMKVWYKLPFEGQKEQKEICNGDANFSKMCSAANWINDFDIFMELASDINVSEDIEYEGDEEGRENRDEHEEEARIDRDVGDFVYEELNELDSGSDSEEEVRNKAGGYLRYKKGSGELKLRQSFDSLEEFKQAVVDYVLKEEWNVKYVRWDKDKSELRCASEGDEVCQWKVYCSYEEPLQKWMIKVYNKEHSCFKSGFCKIINQEIIAILFVNDIRDDPNLMPRDIQEEIQKRWSLIASIDKCRKAKKRALEIIQEEYDEQ